MEFDNDIYQLKITFLNGIKNQPYRIIEVEKNHSLTSLFEAIITSFDMYFGKLFGYYNNIKNWTKATVLYEHYVDDEELEYFARENAQSTDKTMIETMLKQNPKMLLLYDYMTEKRFLIELINEVPLLPNTEYPRTVKKFGKVSKMYY